MEAKFAKMDKAFVTSVRRHVEYSVSEMAAAELFTLVIESVFEPCGEERGTKYDESVACPHCGSGGRQVGPLILPPSRVPKGKDFARTIAGEIVVSRRMVELFERNRIKGARFTPVRTGGKGAAVSDLWSQFVPTTAKAEIVPPTRAGDGPFDEDTEGKPSPPREQEAWLSTFINEPAKGVYRCPHGDTLGLGLLSEITVKGSTLPKVDIMATRQFVGVRRGLLRPERPILISPRLWRLLDQAKVKGIKIEVAHVV